MAKSYLNIGYSKQPEPITKLPGTPIVTLGDNMVTVLSAKYLLQEALKIAKIKAATATLSYQTLLQQIRDERENKLGSLQNSINQYKENDLSDIPLQIKIN